MRSARIRAAGALLLWGARVHLALGDLAMWIEPGLAADERPGRRIRPWAGLLVVLLFAFSLAFVGQGIVWAIHEAAPRREVGP